MIYEIINPSDACTIEAEDSFLASVVVIILGSGAYGLYDEDERMVLPIFRFEDEAKLLEWLRDNDVDPMEMDEFYAKHGDEMASIAESVIYGKMSDRKALVSMIEKMSSSDRLAAIDKWNDSKRSSMADIGSDARNLAKLFRKKAERARIAKAPTDPPPTVA